MKQESFSDMEYRCRKKKTKREEFLEIMDEIIPWDEWISLIVPYYPAGKRGRPPIEIEIMLRMYLLQCWFTLSDEGVEDAISDQDRTLASLNKLGLVDPDSDMLLSLMAVFARAECENLTRNSVHRHYMTLGSRPAKGTWKKTIRLPGCPDKTILFKME